MWIVGQPRRFPRQAERLPYNVGYASGLFVRSDLLGSGQQLLEIGTITNGIPDWINLSNERWKSAGLPGSRANVEVF